MSDNVNLKQFFQNFIANEKEKDDISEHYLCFLKILWNGINEIIQKNKNQRKIFIIEQIELYLTDESFREVIESVELPDQDSGSFSNSETMPNVKLKNINIINFRGFQVGEKNQGRNIVFNEKATLVFAPNGGGKTSLCESLEWALTGDSLERRYRKAEPAGEYFQNNNSDDPKYSNTKLTLNDESIAMPDKKFDRCFLEKNRIEKFAKLAIQPNTELQDVVGELFGFSEIIDFFKEFGKDLSPTDIEKSSHGRENWKIWLDWNNMRTEKEEEIKEAEEDEKKAKDELEKLIEGKTFDLKKVEIEEKGKKIKEDLEKMNKNYSIKFSSKEFQQKIKLYLKAINEWKENNGNIAKHAKELDFENLFQASNIIFQSYTDEECPLCNTPFKQSGSIFKRSGVVIDPRKKTERELKKLKRITNWKEKIKEIEANLTGGMFREIRDEWSNIQHNIKEENWREISKSSDLPNIPLVNFSELEKYIEGDIDDFIEMCEKIFNSDFSKLSKLENEVISYNEKRNEVLKQKVDKEKQIEQLRKQFLELQEKNNNFSAKQQISKSLKEKFKKVVLQKDNSENFKILLNNYLIFYESIKSYYSSLILREGSNIDDYVTGFYRALNLYDHDGEKVKSISFPKSNLDKFSFKYQKDEDESCDALHLLSEGHLKTLGLSSLLARAIKFSVPILIFDDAINAIDSDHRDNIAHLLSMNFSEDDGVTIFGEKWDDVKNFITECQFVITTHDRFFDEKISNLFDERCQKRYVLYSGKNGIDFCEYGSHANFEAKINYFLSPESQDVRSAIFYSRIWLEELLLDIAVNFRKPSNNKLIPFENELDKKTKQLKNPELTIIIDKLISNLKKDETSDDEKTISSLLEDIIREKDDNLIWFFDILNQESHHRRYNHVDISNAPTSIEVRQIYEKIQEIKKLI